MCVSVLPILYFLYIWSTRKKERDKRIEKKKRKWTKARTLEKDKKRNKGKRIKRK
jgi:hypothetical protein